MITIHKIQFPLASDQNQVWRVYRPLKLERPKIPMVEILKEIQENFEVYSKKYVSTDPAFKILSKTKKTPEKLIRLLNGTKDEALKVWLRNEIKKLLITSQ